jgi:hypothetical protein
LRNGIDSWAADNTTGHWKKRSGSHKEGVDFTSGLTTFVDTPVIQLVIAKEKKSSLNKLTKQ